LSENIYRQANMKTGRDQREEPDTTADEVHDAVPTYGVGGALW
jgi:hypothetical protein